MWSGQMKQNVILERTNWGLIQVYFLRYFADIAF